MSAQQPNPSPQEDDPWEQLAENLFGTPYGKEHAVTEPRETPAGRTEPDEPAHTPRQEIVFEEEPEVVASEPAESPIAAEAPPATTTPPVPATSPQDAYWDALANWSWDDEGIPPRTASRSEGERSRQEESRPPQREGNRPPRDRRERSGRDRPGRGPQGGGQPPQRSRESSSRPTHAAPPQRPRETPPEATRAADEESFGAGLYGESPEWEEPKVVPAKPAAIEPSFEGDDFDDEGDDIPPVSGGTAPPERVEEEDRPGDDRPRRRRRRRRRRSRGPESAPAGAESAAAPAPAELSWDDDETDDAGESDRVERAPVAREPESREPRRPEDREREGRHRRRPPAEDFTEVAWEDEEPVAPVAEEPAEPFAEDADDEDGGEQAVSYANMPTWEEAISYLLHPETVQLDTPASGGTNSGGGSRGAPPAAEGRRPNRYVGRGKNRR